VVEVRRLRADYHLETRPLAATIVAGGAAERWTGLAPLVAGLPRARLAPLEVVAEARRAPAHALVLVAGGVQVFVPLEGVLDVAREVERLGGEIQDAGAQAGRMRALLARPGFVEQAPAAVVDGERRKLADVEDRLSKLEARREALRGLQGETAAQ
jgi:valyl-tRNA synthetase